MQHRPPKPTTPFIGKPIVVLVLLVIAIIAIISVIGMYRKYQYARAARDVYVAERTELEKKRVGLAESAAQLDTERGREEEIRSKYRAIKPGEELIVVIPASDPAGIIPSEAERSKDGDYTLWKKITCWFQKGC